MRSAVAACAACLVAIAVPASAHARFEIPAGADQLIVVSSPTTSPPNYLATLRAFERSGPSAPWQPMLGPWPAETGYGHLRAVRREGDGSTPTGLFAIGPQIYGERRNPGGLAYAYHRLVCGDWWDEDPYSRHYNEFVRVRCDTTPAFASWSEPRWTETAAYPYFAVIDFNTDPIRRGSAAPGSGIFLHSWVGGPTAGCVALHTDQLLRLLRWLKPAQHPVIEIGSNRELVRR